MEFRDLRSAVVETVHRLGIIASSGDGGDAGVSSSVLDWGSDRFHHWFRGYWGYAVSRALKECGTVGAGDSGSSVIWRYSVGEYGYLSLLGSVWMESLLVDGRLEGSEDVGDGDRGVVGIVVIGSSGDSGWDHWVVESLERFGGDLLGLSVRVVVVSDREEGMLRTYRGWSSAWEALLSSGDSSSGGGDGNSGRLLGLYWMYLGDHCSLEAVCEALAQYRTGYWDYGVSSLWVMGRYYHLCPHLGADWWSELRRLQLAPVNYGKLALDQFVGNYQVSDGARATDIGVSAEVVPPAGVVGASAEGPVGSISRWWFGNSSGFGIVYRPPDPKPLVDTDTQRRELTEECEESAAESGVRRRRRNRTD